MYFFGDDEEILLFERIDDGFVVVGILFGYVWDVLRVWLELMLVLVEKLVYIIFWEVVSDVGKM